ncbi:PRC-barrel domain-containing protein [Chitinispirillales bacterium ANBcel5]|uniref:PRC-barrel domain-containing protein n=1 Tax=Cellulosispirillum alkaliphilum TaxID=3039283 RepID=UPI002A57C9F9|nr:PRC-barrel domain-containing protein [Chitinispirillales bacterium ANBcel5]
MFDTCIKLYGKSLHATDGKIGKVDDFYFDDTNWALRYLVADVGSWLLGKKILLSPAALGKPLNDSIDVKYSKDQVKHSPNVDTQKPISRKLEEELHDYYSWPYYWVYPNHYNSLGGAIYPGLSFPSGFPKPLGEEPITAQALEKEQKTEEEIRQSHLRSTKELTNYHIQATDEEIGHVEDFILDTEHWVIRYLIVDTKNILPGKKVLLAPQWILGIDWGETKVYADVSADTIRNGPEFTNKTELDRDYEKRLYEYYKRPKYWK